MKKNARFVGAIRSRIFLPRFIGVVNAKFLYSKKYHRLIKVFARDAETR